MGPVLECFVEMGVDVLNPVEPPPMGDVTLPEAFSRVGNRMALEGNIQKHDLIAGTREQVLELMREALEAGKGRRFIMCPCFGYMQMPEPTERHLENLQTYVKDGVRLAQETAA